MSSPFLLELFHKYQFCGPMYIFLNLFPAMLLTEICGAFKF